MPPPKIILYTRQSLTRGDADDSLSLAFQERALRELVKKHGGIVLEPVIVDADEKGWDAKRPGIKALKERVATEHADGIAVFAVSRFARDSYLAEGIWRDLIEINPDLLFLSATEPHADDDFVRGLFGLLSQAERKRMGAFLRNGFAERARQGKAHGKTPYGFTKDAEGRLVVNPDQRPLIVQMVEYCEAGWSFRRIARWLQSQSADDRQWVAKTVHNIIVSPAIAGAIKCGEVLEWGSHEAIIDRDRHERLVAIASTRRFTRTKIHTSWLERLLLCGCGAPLDLHGKHYDPVNRTSSRFRCAADPSNTTHHRRPWPACTYRPRSILVDRAERLVGAALAEALETVPDWRSVEEALVRAYRANAQNGDETRVRLEREAKRLRTQRERLLDLYQTAVIDVPRWKARDVALGDRLAAISTEIAGLPAPPSSDALRESAALLASLGRSVAFLVATDPEKIGVLMRTHGIRAQLRDGGITILWPAELTPFFE